MSKRQPRWRQVFDRVERAVGSPLENVAASTRFVEVMAVGMKVRRVAGGTVRQVVGGVTSKVLWAVDAPTREDVRRINGELASLASEVRALEKQLRDAAKVSSPASRGVGGHPARSPAARPGPGSRGASRG